MFRHAIAAVLTVHLTALCAGAGNHHDGPRLDEPIAARLGELEATLDAIASTKAYAPLFESEHGDIIRAQAMFALAQKAVHDARQQAAEGETINTNLADQFHCALREYIMNVEEMEASASFGATTTPDDRSKKKLLKALAEVREAANAVHGFQEASKTESSALVDVAGAILFARRSLTEVYWLLDHRTLTRATSNGTQAAQDLRAALDAVWLTLDESLDADGNLVLRKDENGRPLSDQLAPFKAAMAEARTQAEFYRKVYVPKVRSDAHRRRAEMIEGLLSESGFEKRLVAVRSLNPTSARVGKR